METEDEDIKRIGYTSAQEFIDIMEEKRKKKELEIKNKVLIHLGLVDKEKSYREYFPYWVNEKCKWDEEARKYYIEESVPLEVSDEEYEEILKYAEIDFEIEEIEKKRRKSTPWSNAIKAVAYIVLIVGIIANLVLLFNVDEPTGLEHRIAEKAADIERWEYIANIIYTVLSFPLLMGFAKLVSAAEKYLHKDKI